MDDDLVARRFELASTLTTVTDGTITGVDAPTAFLLQVVRNVLAPLVLHRQFEAAHGYTWDDTQAALQLMPVVAIRTLLEQAGIEMGIDPPSRIQSFLPVPMRRGPFKDQEGYSCYDATYLDGWLVALAFSTDKTGLGGGRTTYQPVPLHVAPDWGVPHLLAEARARGWEESSGMFTLAMPHNAMVRLKDRW